MSRHQLMPRVAVCWEPRWWPLLWLHRFGPKFGGGWCLMLGPVMLDVEGSETQPR